MNPKTFNGGVHLKYNKELTQNKSIEKIKLPSKVTIPFHQHTGIPCNPIVKTGDIVQTGQKIGEADGFITSPVHASISGKIIEISPKLSPWGKPILSCIIESDGQDIWHSSIKSRSGYLKLTSGEIVSIIKEAGIVGQGGAAFPSHVKYNPPQSKVYDTLIINGAECEPYLTCDHRLMLENSKEIIAGIEIIMYAMKIKKVYIGIETNKLDAIEILKIAGKNTLGLEIIPLQVKYPQGSEKHLIKAITNKEVPPGGFPLEVGVLVNNVGTMIAVYKAVMEGKPLIERVITVTGNGINEPKNLLVRIGSSLNDIFDNCGGLKSDIGKIIIGGPMMGMAQYTMDIPIIKGTSGVIVFPKEETKISNVTFCIRCGQCVEVCPMKLQPFAIADRSEFNYYNDIEQQNLMDCIECGCCSYICPAERHMVHLIRQAKLVMNKKKGS